MEKFREKLSSLRTEADNATARGDELENRVKSLENEGISKDHEIKSLEIRVKNLENELEVATANLAKVTTSYNDSKAYEENAERKVTALELESQDKEEKYESLLEKYNASKAELDELARQFDEL
ncbi:hypothetical protein J3Q64DRAFT_1733001 [Phycomyces blakesleeanus]|uniref:Tropomyosin n=2 Tax=Phycomyces blakesleeanus TaxID=4837 RepID=A0A162PQA3_PHYB8|nr:hypothetical protein PHYBLDRAFT_187469 [Phycomyces blakesleeanus NRRL 1555(-)]OAD71916.1 hypothetical protein PHYBLDRAFT_187469 [Phycomyces blakesleeanus NRRL 1555(-)]|eukprot:XP_018289956.1 hypothetical protein PHYBLDRAFT_187469 [Phycomyces blakesleeanus NRRL 1555(-)]